MATLRVLSRAGLRVGAVAGESDAWWAPGLQSRLCGFRATTPDLGDDAATYAAAVVRLLDAQPARMLLPAHDGTIQALRLRRAEIERRTALPLASEAALEIAINKARTLALGAELGLSVPQSCRIETEVELTSALKHAGFPAVLKPVESWVERDGKGVRLSPNVVRSMHEAREIFGQMIGAGGRALLQPFLPGRREAVSLFYADGRFWARLAQRSFREWPVLGGASVLCETIPLLPDITSDAERLVRAMDLEGCSMVEFRRDREGRAVLMEVNPRMGGSVALAIAAGVNFPGLLYDWKVNGKLAPITHYRVGKRLRWLAGDIWNLKCSFEMQGHPDIPSPLRATAAFIGDFARPGNTLDGVEIGDMRPALAELNRLVFRHGRRRMRRIFSSNQLLLSEG
ncbi:MAG: ATP-grasp domain-containing protein [Chloroflexi bacterium]|nr:ATP-grasp domain-containing protein [Chloroflexota bacterium]